MSQIRVKPLLKKWKVENQKELLDKINLTGLRDWSLDEQKSHGKPKTYYTSIFTMSDIHLGQTSLVKHFMRIMDNTPFK